MIWLARRHNQFENDKQKFQNLDEAKIKEKVIESKKEFKLQIDKKQQEIKDIKIKANHESSSFNCISRPRYMSHLHKWLQGKVIPIIALEVTLSWAWTHDPSPYIKSKDNTTNRIEIILWFKWNRCLLTSPKFQASNTFHDGLNDLNITNRLNAIIRMAI